MPDGMTCERVELEELDLRYIRGTLPEELAEAFEAHFFGCDRCWALVRGGNELRAARGGATAPRRPRVWAMALAAAVVGAVGVGLWRDSRRTEPAVTPASLERGGPATALVLGAATEAGRLAAHWSRVPGAATYRVRFFGADGSVLLSRETPDTALTVARDSLGGPGGSLLWQVQALDRLGGELIRSALVEVVPR